MLVVGDPAALDRVGGLGRRSRGGRHGCPGHRGRRGIFGVWCVPFSLFGDLRWHITGQDLYS